MADGESGYIKEVLIFLGAVIAALLGKGTWDYFSGKTKAETKQISITGDVSLLEMTDKVAKDYISLFRDATTELKAAGIEIKDLTRKLHEVEHRLERASRIIRKMLLILKQANHDGLEQLEKEATEILEA